MSHHILGLVCRHVIVNALSVALLQCLTDVSWIFWMDPRRLQQYQLFGALTALSPLDCIQLVGLVFV